jgi:hypothetical protein
MFRCDSSRKAQIIALCKRVKYGLLCGDAERRHTTKILGVLNSFAHRYSLYGVHIQQHCIALRI